MHCLDHAGELGQHAIAGRINEPSMMSLENRIDELAMRVKSTQRRLFVVSHEAAIAVDIGAKDSSELTLQSFTS
jgi:hypothetical protein